MLASKTDMKPSLNPRQLPRTHGYDSDSEWELVFKFTVSGEKKKRHLPKKSLHDVLNSTSDCGCRCLHDGIRGT